MKVPYWDVGANDPVELQMSSQEISEHLLADWMPGTPAGMASAACGWPAFMLTNRSKRAGDDWWRLVETAGSTERQWKGVMSWMLGVAGTRHVLHHLGYRWIAPVSAFYPNATHPPATPDWHPRYPRTRLRIDRDPSLGARTLRPDYVALKPGTGGLEWALVESKGTEDSLTGKVPKLAEWKKQARNAVVRVDGRARPIIARRHIVIATRVNTNATSERMRRIQIRAWNAAEPPTEPLPEEAQTAIVGTHLFGLFHNLRQEELAFAVADSLAEEGDWSVERDRTEMLARQEIAALRTRSDGRVVRVPVETSLGVGEATVPAALVDLAERFLDAREAPQIVPKVREAEVRLDAWDAAVGEREPKRETRRVSAGLALRLPEPRRR